LKFQTIESEPSARVFKFVTDLASERAFRLSCDLALKAALEENKQKEEQEDSVSYMEEVD
jgi:hypothetical protein